MIVQLNCGALKLQKLWNPFRDWNFLWQLGSLATWRFKNSETLLGIETHQDWKQHFWPNRFKNSETLLGIETTLHLMQCANLMSFKNSETLLGIETTI